MAEHCGTHLDVPGHFVEGGTTVARVPLSTPILPGHLLDPTHKKVGEAITIADCEEAEKLSGCTIALGTAVVAWTGVDRVWGTPGFQKERPYIAIGNAEGLADRDMTLAVTDLIGVDDLSEWWWSTHYMWLSRGICLCQQVCNLDRLIGKEFTLVVLPLKMRDGTASPVRPVALVG